MIKENGKIVKCPECGSTNIIKVEPFDYVKQCNNDDCPFRKQNLRKWRYQFSTGVHN
jgi:hypothetical protein